MLLVLRQLRRLSERLPKETFQKAAQAHLPIGYAGREKHSGIQVGISDLSHKRKRIHMVGNGHGTTFGVDIS